MRSVSRQRSPSARATPANSAARGGPLGPGQTSSSTSAASRARPSPGSGRVAKTRGRARESLLLLSTGFFFYPILNSAPRRRGRRPSPAEIAVQIPARTWY